MATRTQAAASAQLTRAQITAAGRSNDMHCRRTRRPTANATYLLSAVHLTQRMLADAGAGRARVDVLEADANRVKEGGKNGLPMQQRTGGEVKQARGDAVVPGQG